MTRLLLAMTLLLCATPAFAQVDDWEHAVRRDDGVHLRILKDYELPAAATSREPVVVIGGSATIDGRVDDDVVVIGGTLRIGPTAIVRGDVAAIGGEAIIDPAARISGEISRTSMTGPAFDLGVGWLTRGWWAAFALGATLLRLALVLIVAMLLVVVAPDWINDIARRAWSAPLTSAGIGVAAQVLFVPGIVAVTVALVVSIIGIALLAAFPFLLGAAALLWVAGFAAVATNIGARLRGRAGAPMSPMLDLLIGFAAISAVTLVAHTVALGGGGGPLQWMLRGIGWLIEWTAWTVALGAALAALLGSRYPAPPPLPYRRPVATAS
jgi:hypothetical protein